MEVPSYYPSISLYLSNILDIYGMREDLRKKRRHLFIKMEVLKTSTDLASGKRIANYHFGSQTEATTLLQFQSDVDTLYSFTDFDVKQSVDDWLMDTSDQRYRKYKLVINSNYSPPGYVRLQDISPVSADKLATGELVEDDGKYFYSSSTVFRILEEKGTLRQGPSKADDRETAGRLTADRVYAFPCKTWPSELLSWIVRKRDYGWPSEFTMVFAMSKGCFMVPVGHKLSYNSDIEWRLSPSLAERILMFSLNETQIKCYVIFKHLIKYFIKPRIGLSLTSFQCKTAVLTCAEITPCDIWKPDRLLECLDICLGLIIIWCGIGWCPQYILPNENIFAGRMKRKQLNALGEFLISIYNSKWKILRSNDGWGLSDTLQHALAGPPYILSSIARQYPDLSYQTLECSSNDSFFQDILETTEAATDLFIKYQWEVELAVNILQILIDADNTDVKTCFKNLLYVQQQVAADYKRNQNILKDTAATIMPVIFMYTGAIISSLPGRRSNKEWWSTVYAEWILPNFKKNPIQTALKLVTVLLKRGIESLTILSKAYHFQKNLQNRPQDDNDMTWVGQLMLFQAEIEDIKDQHDFIIAECVLDHIESEYLKGMVHVCPCRLQDCSKQHNSLLLSGLTESELHVMTCIFFMRGEMDVVPYPLMFEYYRCTNVEIEARDPYKDKWMDIIAVDPAPLLYFLKYECYRLQKKQTERQKALFKLWICIRDDEDLFHKETAMNLLGYCMLLENRLDNALQCYVKSLQIQPNNNCARWHIALMLSKLIRS